MIKCNLAVLMAERQLKMVDVIESTKIAKATIRALYHNTGKGVQFETMNTICEFLRVTPGELFTHIKFKVQVINTYEKSLDRHEVDIRIKIDDDTFEDRINVRVVRKGTKSSYMFTAPHQTFDKLAMLSRQYVRYELFSALYSSLKEKFDDVEVELFREENEDTQ